MRLICRRAEVIEAELQGGEGIGIWAAGHVAAGGHDLDYGDSAVGVLADRVGDLGAAGGPTEEPAMPAWDSDRRSGGHDVGADLRTRGSLLPELQAEVGPVAQIADAGDSDVQRASGRLAGLGRSVSSLTACRCPAGSALASNARCA